jgi:hypothetical protein
MQLNIRLTSTSHTPVLLTSSTSKALKLDLGGVSHGDDKFTEAKLRNSRFGKSKMVVNTYVSESAGRSTKAK